MPIGNLSIGQGNALDSVPLPILRSKRTRGKFPTSDDRWALVEAFIKEGGLVRHQIESFNDFIERRLQKIINEVGVIETDIKGLYIKLEKIEVGKPRVREADASEHLLYPMEARLRNLTYAAPLYLTMALYVNDEEVDRQRVYIGDLPIMVRSKYCNLYGLKREELIKKLEDPDDPGGYFIINGSERVVVSQEDLAPNRPFYDKGDKASITHVAKVISIGAGYKTTVTVERHKDGIIYVTFPAVATRIPFPIIMRALGLETDEDIVLAVSDDPDIQNELLPSLQYSLQIASTVEDALDFIGSKVAIGQPREVRIERAKQVLDRYFLPHLGTTEDARLKKALMVGQMVKGVIEMYLGRREPDDKDHMANKRVRLVGDLLDQLFRAVFKQLVQDIRQQLEKHYSRGKVPSLVTIVRADIITERVRHALATGNWVGGRTGVSQMLDRTNLLSTLSHLRRVVSNLSRTQPHFEARDLHPTQWGRLCAIETPEGQNCGLVKNLALLATVTVGVDENEVEKLLYDLGVIPILTARKNGVKGTEVYLNGRLIGIHTDPDRLVMTIREMRRRGQISHEINVARIRRGALDEVRVNCDAGRLRRPVLIIENGNLKLKPEHIEKLRSGEWSWSDLINNGIIEYLDGDEEENALIAINPEDDLSKYTHMEIIPSAMLGAVASIIPYAEHNQSPRNIYEAAMAKQSLGFPAANYRFRLDSRGHLLIYPERPLVITRGIELNGYLRRPAGQNAVVALLTYTGYNMEDAVILNKASIERGMYRSVFYRTYETEQMRYPGGEEDRIEIPSPEVKGYKGPEAYAHLDEDGIVPPEVFVSGGEVLIGKTSPPRFYGVYTETVLPSARRDSSITVRRGERGIVDSVLITETNEGYKLVKVKVRELRIPELGDKFASRHGQKGVTGMIIPMEDMPFTEDGITPDIIVNPHALPSRMTVGQLLESMAGKIAALRGVMIDATPFEGVTEEELRDLLIRSGFRWDGKEVMYSGITGRKLEADIFIGIVYYQKLHHMVADKIHARARGPVQILTRQPTEGRSREGGLRLGEMERDVLIAHGAAALLRERLMESSDKYVMYVCEDCGMIAWYDANKGKPVCPIHGDKGRIARVIVPYAFKLLLQELISLGIYPKIELGDLIEERRA
ncbi:MAG: DNA-directed RNA polymerase subunit B [Vulcanisaeta sp.]|nr:DNA-directed RNA polymerase subunit B [Vulcanisaeta sp.]MCG2892167.1 DNA-directed RNA polymerase subunit B [Vulcanisaeta sp.]MCG2894812.1 DNA-directed RNA polymerase subunit B [Vulcanisaeta sp.]